MFYLSVVCMRVCVCVCATSLARSVPCLLRCPQSYSHKVIKKRVVVKACARVIKSLKKRVVVKACAVSLWSEMDPFDLRWTLLIWDGPFRSEMDPFDLRWTLSIWDGPFWSEMSCLHRTSYEIIKDHIMSNITSYVWRHMSVCVLVVCVCVCAGDVHVCICVCVCACVCVGVSVSKVILCQI